MALVQTCDVDEEPCSNFLTAIDDNTITKSLYTANGRCGDVGVSVTKDHVTKCYFSMPSAFQPVPEPTDFYTGLNVVDIDVLCFANGRHGIVVAMNNPAVADDDEPEKDGGGFATKKEKAERDNARPRPFNPVGLYMENRFREFKLYRTIKVYGEITCVRVLINPVDMSSQLPFLSARIGTWPNVVAIGCQKSSCYLGQFAAFDPANAEHWANEEVTEIVASTDALKALTDAKGRFTYRTHNTIPEYWNKEDVSVTAIAYIPCYGASLIGLSNGAIVLVPMDGKSCITCFTIPYASPVRHLVVLEPEYDPQGGFYVFSARDRVQQRNNKSLPMMVTSHKVARQGTGDDGGYEYTDMSTVMIPLLDGYYWLNVHGIVKRRRRRETDAGNDTTGGDTSQLPEGLNTTQNVHSDGMERVLLFYSYISSKGELKGGLFDLNAYYSRRCGIAQVRFDEYGQNDICSQFTMAIPQRENGAPLFRIKDISFVHCESIARYSTPIFDRDVLFQPQAAALCLRIHTFGKHAYTGTVDSLQFTALDRISRSLSACLAQPDVALAWLQRTGLLHAPTTKRERLKMDERPANERVPTDLDKIMRAVVSDAYVRKRVIRFIEECRDRKQLLHVGRWAFNELRDIVVRLDESIAPIFDDGVSPASLSKDASELIAYCPDFFEFAELLFWRVRTRMQEMCFDTPKLRWTRKMHALMAFDLRLFLAAVKWCNRKLPMHEDWPQELMEGVAALNEQRSEQAKAQSHPLFLDALLRRLHDRTMDDGLWRGAEDPRAWYPPARFDLLSLLRMSDAPLEDRIALALYLLMDVDEVVKREAEKTEEEERRAWPVPEEGVVKSFLISEPGQLMKDKAAGCAGVRERWESDLRGAGHKENAGGQQQASKQASKLTEEETEELKKLIDTGKLFRRLQKVDEDRMKVLCNKMGFGDYRFNVYLIKKSRWPEVQDLPVPAPGEPFPHSTVAEYAKYKELALYQKSQLPPPTYSNAFACPYVLTKAASKTQTPTPARIVRTDNITIRGKTPKKLGVFRRATTGAAAAAAAADAAVSTPPSRATQETARINALLKTPSMGFRKQAEDEEEGGEMDSDIAPDEMARVREALRTPRSRARANAARAAAAAGQGTPEDAPRPAMIAPTSILKSANKESRLGAMTPKSRLRFASVFEEKSISPRERDNSASTASMSQPNFDDSYEDDVDHVLSKSTASHGSDSLSTTTRLEREIEEEEQQMQQQQRHAGRRGEEREEESHEASMLSGAGDVVQLSSGGEEEEEEEQMTGESGEERVEEAEKSEPFNVYHDSNLDVSSMDDDSHEAVFSGEDAAAAAAAGDTAAAGDVVPVDEENVSRAVTPEDEGEEEEKRPEEVAVEEEEKEEEAAAPAAAAASVQQPAAAFFLPPPIATSTPLYPIEPGNATFTIAGAASHATTTPTAAAADATFTFPAATAASAATATPTAAPPADSTFTIPAAAASATPTPAAANETYTLVESTFAVNVGADVVEGAESGEEEEEDAAVAAAAVEQPADDAEEKDEAAEEQPNLSRASTPVDAPAAEEKEEEEKAEEQPNLSRASTPIVQEDQEEEEEAAAGEDVVAVEEEKNVSRGVTPEEQEDVIVEEEEKEEEQQVEEDDEPEVIELEEEEEAPATHSASVPAAVPPTTRAAPPVPMRRTVFASRAEPISLGLRSYIYMEDGIEKSYEEQRESSDDDDEEKEKGEAAKDILARLSPRRSSSRLQQQHGGGGGAETTAEAAAAIAAPAATTSPSTRKRPSRARKDSEEESAGPSSSRSPRGKRDRREEEEEEKHEEKEAGEEDEGHLYTTTRTRVIEERYVARDDGVLQHTVKQSTKVIEMTDGEVVKEEQEDRETIEEEGDREDVLDEADRVTPPMVEAAPAPATDRRSSRKPVPAPRARTVSTASRSSSRAAKKDEEEEKKEREEKATTPLRTPAKTTAARRKLPTDDDDEEKKTEEPLTPRRSTRTRRPSESAASVVSATTPTKSLRRSSRALKTPSREPSVAPVSPTRRLVLDDSDEEAEKQKATVAKPATPKRGRPRKEVPVDDDVEVVVPVKRKTLSAAAAPSVGSARKRAASESVAKKKEEEEKEEEWGGMARLRQMKAESAAQKAAAKESLEASKKNLAAMDARREKAERRKARATMMPVIDEDKEAKTVEKPEKEEDEGEEQPTTSRAASAARRKRSASETVTATMKGKEAVEMKTPSKKRSRGGGDKDEDEESAAGDLSHLRRSSRKAAVAANEGLKTPLKTPSKSTRSKQ